MNTKLILLTMVFLLMFLSFTGYVYAYSVSDFFASLNQLANRFIALFLPRSGSIDIAPTILRGAVLLSSCTNHAQCSQACTSSCPASVYGCCYGCKLGQCIDGVCKCVDAQSYCSGGPPYQMGQPCLTTAPAATPTTTRPEPPIVFTTFQETNNELTIPVNFMFTISDTTYTIGVNKNSIKYKVESLDYYYKSGWKEIPAESCQGNCEAWPGVCTCTLENFYTPLSYYVDYRSSYGFLLVTSFRMTISTTTGSSTADFKVVKITQNRPPEISITSPSNESTLKMPFDVSFTAVDEIGINKDTVVYEILDLAGNVIERKATACPKASGVLTCELPGISCSCLIKGISVPLTPGNSYILRVNISDLPVPLTIYGPQQPNMVEPMQGSSEIVFTATGEKFQVTAFECTQIVAGQYKCAVQYTNPLTEQVLISFVFSKIGRAITKTALAPPGTGTAEVTFSCSESSGMHIVSWRAFRASNRRVPIAWSILTALKTITCS